MTSRRPDRDPIWLYAAICLGLAACIIAMALSLSTRAHAHDVYTDLRQKNGLLCCGGDPVRGDCEELWEKDFTVNVDQSVTVRSKRYHATILVGADKVVWLPVAGSDAPAHWCGTKRSNIVGAPLPDGDNPDPAWWSYCMFVTPGGV